MAICYIVNPEGKGLITNVLWEKGTVGNLRTGYVNGDFKQGGQEELQSQCLPNYCIEIRKGHEVIVIEVSPTRSRICDLLAESSLNIWILSQNVEDASQRSRGCVHCRKYQSARMIPIRVPYHKAVGIYARHLAD
jgi:hypothetical protein